MALNGTDLRMPAVFPRLSVAWCFAMMSCSPEPSLTVPPVDASGPGAAPRAVVGPRTPQIAGGTSHTCVVLPDGGVACWGANQYGQLGDGTGRPSRVPVRVAGVHGIVALASGYNHTCALQRTGTVMCWGDDMVGQLGDGTKHSPDYRLARMVPQLTRVSSIAAMGDQTCALQSAAVWCWGRLHYSLDVYDAPRFHRLRDQDAQELCSGGSFLCERHGGRVSCWNTSAEGEPSEVPNLVDADALACGERGACVVRRDGTVACWGLTDGDAWWSMQAVPEVSNAVDVSVGHGHACALDRNGTVTCWGENKSGELGTYLDAPGAHAVRTPAPMDAIGVGRNHSCGRLRDGRFACWGDNERGKSGWGMEPISLTPERVADLTGIDGVLAAGRFTCAMRQGEALCWGHVDGLAPDIDLHEPTHVDAFTHTRGLMTMPDGKPCMWAADGSARCLPGGPNIPTRDVLQIVSQITSRAWVLRSDGAWIDPYAEPLVTPEDLADLASGVKPQPILEIAPWSMIGLCARLKGGTVRCNSALRDAKTSSAAVLVGRESRPLSDVRALRSSEYMTCALLGDGTVACMDNHNFEKPALMELVPGLRDVIELAAGNQHFCTRTRGGEIYCWGSNYNGQLGDGTTLYREKPVKVPGVTHTRALALGENHTCVLTQQREVMCWGAHQGNGRLAHAAANARSASPVLVGSGGL